jgi:steroid delta-isomerase
MTGRELMEAHLRAFNLGVATGEWGTMLVRFADDAELRFEGVPAGPFSGRAAIEAAYREQPPDDVVVPLGIQETDEHTVAAAFAWSRGGTGRLVLEHDRGTIKRLTVVFDE